MEITDEMVETAAAAITEALDWLPTMVVRAKVSEAARAALTAVAPLIAAREREECALIADDLLDPYGADDGYSARAIADAIRARGTP